MQNCTRRKQGGAKRFRSSSIMNSQFLKPETQPGDAGVMHDSIAAPNVIAPAYD
jgi:hypothetical protein